MSTISIGIPTYNGWMRIHQLIQNIRQRTSSDIDYEIIICDDSGKNEHRDKVKEICNTFGVKFVYHEHNRGVPASWNTLVKSSSSPYIILLNDDILVANGWLVHPLYAIQNNPQAGSFGLHCYFITPQDVAPLLSGPTAQVIPLNVRWIGSHLERNERFDSMPEPNRGSPGRMMCPTGCAFGFRKEMWDLIGGFDEQYRAFYEETDFGVSCAQLGFPSYQLAFPGNYHIWSQTFGSAPEINAGAIMNDSRKKFIKKWTQKLGIHINDAPDIHPFLMDKIPLLEIKWLDIDLVEQKTLL